MMVPAARFTLSLLDCEVAAVDTAARRLQKATPSGGRSMPADPVTDPSRRRILQGAAGLVAGALASRTQPAFAEGEAAIATKPIPHSGEHLPVIGLGTANEFMTTPEGDAKANLKRANLKKVVDDLLAQGCKLIDTASSYGAAESVLGDLLSDQDRAKVFLATKIENGDKTPGLAEFRHSLERLRYKQVDLLQLHNVRNRHQDLSATGKRKAFAAISGSPRPTKMIMAQPKRSSSGRSRTSFRSIIRWPTARRRSACFPLPTMPARPC